MLAVPLSGWFFSNSYDKDVAFFGIVLSRLFVVNKGIAEFGRSMHFWLAYSFLAFIVLHAIDQWKLLRATVRRYYKAVVKKFASSSRITLLRNP
ncbi:MAG: cytochrome b/b6 domain-containing protein [Hormoscilla sp. SP12CHS1]|nr:cytochrome b/b6 domain-containing protein [Hormoscilla sp. SP12CHS1]